MWEEYTQLWNRNAAGIKPSQLSPLVGRVTGHPTEVVAWVTLTKGVTTGVTTGVSGTTTGVTGSATGAGTAATPAFPQLYKSFACDMQPLHMDEPQAETPAREVELSVVWE